MKPKEAFEKWFGWRHINQYTVAYEAWNAALEWAAKGQEPAAWIACCQGQDVCLFIEKPSDEQFPQKGCWKEPLYLHPAPTPAG